MAPPWAAARCAAGHKSGHGRGLIVLDRVVIGTTALSDTIYSHSVPFRSLFTTSPSPCSDTHACHLRSGSSIPEQRRWQNGPPRMQNGRGGGRQWRRGSPSGPTGMMPTTRGVHICSHHTKHTFQSLIILIARHLGRVTDTSPWEMDTVGGEDIDFSHPSNGPPRPPRRSR